MAPTPITVHYDEGTGWPACGVKSRKNLTARPPKVTCQGCKMTPSYRQMMEE